MKICILAGKADPRGGSTRYVRDIVEGLQARGHTVEIETYDSNPLTYFFRVRRKARSFDVVHAIDLNPRGFVGFCATRFTKAKFVMSAIGTYAVTPLYSRKLGWLARKIYKDADALMAISSFTKREIEKLVPGVRIEVLTPGIDLSNFKRMYVVDEGRKPYLLSVGSIKRRKGYDISLKAFLLVRKEFPDMRYVIVGAHIDEPEYVKELMRMVKDAHAEESVDFIKDISDAELRKYYENATLFILTSVNEGTHFEGFGIVFLEAAAYGLPSIGTSGNGIEDAMEGGKTGILVPQKDVEETARAIKKLLSDAQMRTRMSERAKTFAEEHDRQYLAKRYEAIYKSVLQV